MILWIQKWVKRVLTGFIVSKRVGDGSKGVHKWSNKNWVILFGLFVILEDLAASINFPPSLHALKKNQYYGKLRERALLQPPIKSFCKSSYTYNNIIYFFFSLCIQIISSAIWQDHVNRQFCRNIRGLF